MSNTHQKGQVFIEKEFRSSIATLLESHQVKRFMLVCGSSFHKQQLAAIIKSLPISHVLFSEYSPNPKYEEIVKGVELFKQEHCDFIIAAGGGSTMDTAKCIKLFSTLDSSSLYITQEFKENNIPLLAIPTTAGSGSESTRYAVLYYQGEKYSMTHNSIIPSYVVLDPTVLETLPLYQKKASMLDALTQAIESWWSVNSTDESKTYAKKAIDLIITHLNDYLANTWAGNQGMLIASNWAGKAINISQTTAAHAMSYMLTSTFKIAHGHAVAIGLPFLWSYMCENLDKCIDPRGRDYVKNEFYAIAHALNTSTPQEAINSLKALLRNIEISAPSCNDDKVLETLIHSVNLERLKNNPIALDAEAIASIYRKILS